MSVKTVLPLITCLLAITIVGHGTVTGSGSGFSGPGTYPLGSTFALVANPAPGSEFVGWGGSCSGTTTCNVALNSNQSVTATFTKIAPPVLSDLRLSHYGLYVCTPNGKPCHQKTIEVSFKYVGPKGALHLRIFRSKRLIFSSRSSVTGNGYVIVPRRFTLVPGVYTVKAEAFAGSQSTALLTKTIRVR